MSPRTSRRSLTSRAAHAMALAALTTSMLLTFFAWRGTSRVSPPVGQPYIDRRVSEIGGTALGTLLFIMIESCLTLRARLAATQALRESEERFRLLVEAVEDYAICMLDPPGNVVGWNSGAARVHGFEGSDILGSNISRFYPTDLPDTATADLAIALDTGRFETQNWRVRKDGSRFWADVVITALRDKAGNIRGFCNVTRDMTQRKHVELLEADRRAVLEMVAQNHPLPEVLNRLTRIAEVQCPDMISSVVLVRDGRVEHAVAANLPQAFLDAIAPHAAVLMASLTRSDADTPIVADIAIDPAWTSVRELVMSHRLRTSLLFPIRAASGKLLGAFISYYAEGHQPSMNELELLNTASKLAAIAVEHRQLTDQLSYQARHDPLTGLPHRGILDDRLQQALTQARRSGKRVALFYIDLDHFKTVNDTLGHEAGDLLLQHVARRFRNSIRESDTLVRMGGDEFTLVLPDLTGREDAVRVAHKLLDTLKLPFEINGHQVYSNASVGIATYPQDGTTAVDLQKNADTAMYRAKHSGRGTIECFAAEMNVAATERLNLEGQLRKAIDAGQFELHYQPQVNREGQVTALEALVRWNHPTMGQISPAKFLNLAEETRLIVPLGTWILHEACRQNKMWQDARHPFVKVLVNISPLQFAQSDFIRTLEDALKSTALDPRWLELELNEQSLMHDASTGAHKLNAIRAAGVAITIDDFGTGYSSLGNMHGLPIDALKIDISFVRDMTTDRDTAVVKAITALAHNLGMKVVAEGVETAQQQAFLLHIGCDGLQGYLFGPPRPHPEVLSLLTTATPPIPAPLSA